jgi:hypothetical protein
VEAVGTALPELNNARCYLPTAPKSGAGDNIAKASISISKDDIEAFPVLDRLTLHRRMSRNLRTPGPCRKIRIGLIVRDPRCGAGKTNLTMQREPEKGRSDFGINCDLKAFLAL